MAAQTINPAAQAFRPRPALPHTPSPSPPRANDLFGMFTLSAHPADSSGTIPTTYSTTRPIWLVGIESVRAPGPAEMVDVFCSLEACGKGCAKSDETLLANLAPKYNCTPTSSPMVTYRVRFYSNTPAGIHHLQILHACCKAWAYFNDEDSAWATPQFLDRLNQRLGAFDTKPGDFRALRAEIEAVQKWPIVEREAEQRALAAQREHQRQLWEQRARARALNEIFSGKAKGPVVIGGGYGGERAEEAEERIARMSRPLRELNEGSVADPGPCSCCSRRAVRVPRAG